MCGRYASLRSAQELAEVYGAERFEAADLGQQYNVAPTDSIYAVLDRAPKDDPEHVQRQIHTVRWGLVPSWAKDTKGSARRINARVETVADKPSWRKAFRQRRALIPASGYYEWVADTNADGKTYKQPYYLHPAAGGVLNFAALYEWWRDPTKAGDAPDRWLWSAAIITCAATGPAGEVHDRTPVAIPPDLVDAWLNPAATDPAQALDVIAGLMPPLLGVRAVSTEVNRVGTNGPQLIEPLTKTTSEPTIQLAVA